MPPHEKRRTYKSCKAAAGQPTNDLLRLYRLIRKHHVNSVAVTFSWWTRTRCGEHLRESGVVRREEQSVESGVKQRWSLRGVTSNKPNLTNDRPLLLQSSCLCYARAQNANRFVCVTSDITKPSATSATNLFNQRREKRSYMETTRPVTCRRRLISTFNHLYDTLS